MFDPLLPSATLPMDAETLAATADEAAEEQETDEALLPLTDEAISLDEDDKALSELLNSLHSTKVRRMHKYTDEQLALMHKHTEYNRMLEAYVDVSIYNGHVSRNDVLFHVNESFHSWEESVDSSMTC